ncbi:AI-2E family transporter [Agromyces aerolatus]|uniref:AI-2E family transporter n=1 Tax=Agromyces sp. LY-1074 TaxID=3074080 RepID=UPI0028616302|nr:MULTISPECIES: AI-2E family transporter [unclassified Agromyces]MDR5699700.1 AI-2E family transporter [Agromyces sp. LY-1074]MDR5705996.1 AI-2E family transporter [Agromyces sp. LY-1358]
MWTRARRRRRDDSPEQAAAELTAAVDARAPEVKIRAFRIGFVGAIGVLFALLLGSIVGQLGTVILYVALALFLALGLDPLVSWLQKRMPRWLAILLVVVAVVGLFVGLIATIVPIVIEQTRIIVEDWPTIVDNVEHSDFVVWLNGIIGGDAIAQGVTAIGDWLGDPDNFGSLTGGILAVGAGIAGGFTGATIVLILTLYFLASLHSMKRYSTRFVPKSSRRKFVEVSDEITGSVGRYVIGQGSLGLINGVLSFIYLSIIGAPAPILLAFVAFLCSLVPLIGTLTGAIIITLVSFAASPQTALAAAIYYLIYMQIEAYVLSPRIMNRAVAVPGALVVIAAVAGGTLGGVLGALVAIPVAASLITIVEKVVFPRQDSI